MIRLTLLSVAIGFLALYAWKDWYRALCGLIVLMAFLEHRDMPRAMFGIPGLNPWNFLLFVILLAWMTQRRRERLRWDMPPHLAFLLLLYLGVIVVGFARLMADRHGLDSGTATLVSDYLVNPIKYVVPGLLLFDGCRSRDRLLWALAALVLLYLLLGIQVIRWVPLSAEFVPRASRALYREIGYNRVTLSVVLAGASWAILAVCPLARARKHQLFIVGASLVVLLAQVLTGGRGGYVAWLAAGLVLGLLRWPRYLLLAPVVALAVILLLPGVADRALQGVAEHDGTERVDIDNLTAGRNIIWPIVVAKIGESPIIGHGRAAVDRTGLREQLFEIMGESFKNPHSAYLELLLDSGSVGLLVVLAFYVAIVVLALGLLRDRRSPTVAAVGGAAAALVITFLVGSITGESFYPREGTLGMWCAIGLLVRVWVQRERVRAAYSESAHRARLSIPAPGAAPAFR